MVNKSGNIGTRGESAVVAVLRVNGWGNAERRRPRGTHDPGDITGTPALCWSIKAGERARAMTPGHLTEWRAALEVQRQNVNADLGILVVHRRGYGYDRAAHWWAVVPWLMLADLHAGIVTVTGYRPETAPVLLELRHLLPILRAAGYGDPR